MKHILPLLIFVIITTQVASAASDTDCETKKGFDLYNCRVKTVCEPQEFNSKKPLYQTEKYENAENFKGLGGINQEAFKNAQQVYKSNMSNIYKCAIISSQKVALKKVKDMLRIEKTGTLDDEMGRDIDLKIQKNDLSSSSIGCKNPDDKIIYNKLNVLNETTFEICKYVTYLEYLKIYYGEISNLIEPNPNASPEQVESYPNSYVSNEVFGIIQKIDTEAKRTYTVAGTVFQAYSEYENNLAIHLFLQLIKKDYIVIREKLYQAINPINQVVYKISNAMQK